MLRLLNLAYWLLKWSFWLTLARLLSTAFGWEFGVSRQYLLLLEWLFERGQERIAKVDSEHRMHLNQLDERLISRNGSSDSELYQMADRPKTLKLNEVSNQKENHNENKCNGMDISPIPKDQRRKVSILSGHSINRLEMRFENGITQADRTHPTTLQKKTSTQEQQRRRRISTPDGPPVFLLDDEDDDEDDECTKEDNLDNNQQQVSSSQVRNQHRHEFHLEDAARFVVKGVSAICDDEVTKRFTPEQLKTWNLLTRNNAKNYQFMSRSLGFYWFCGLVIRYALLMPLRIMFTIVGTLWLVGTMSLIGLLVPRAWRNKPFKLMSLMSFRMLACGITSRLEFHDHQNRARGGDICVANHTSPIDVVLLACDNCYALVGQRHGGLLGLLEVALSRATNHVWFDRGEMRDRQLVTQRLKEHVSIKSNLPVLIFPEGTCINNSAVMMFRKGSFETSARICPVAIKYDSRFGDPFWNSSKQSYLEYLLMMMSSWAIKCDVWYLPPMEKLENESSAEFANRVKAAIARRAGLPDLAWDGQLKRSSVKPTWLYQQQEDYVKRLKLE